MPHDSGAAGVDSPADQLRLSLQQQWDAPPVAAAVVVLKAMGVDAGELDADGLRATLFFPTAADAGRYAGAIRVLAPGGGRKELKGSEKKIAVALLTLLYLSHLRPSRSTAQSFAAAFVLADGLASLAGLLEHANLHIRAQAVETLKLLTAGSEDVGDDDDDGYELLDWFGDASRDPQRALNGKLAGLADDGSFIGGLLANRGKGASYPGGGYACMQLLAFWLSWVRLWASAAEQRRGGGDRVSRPAGRKRGAGQEGVLASHVEHLAAMRYHARHGATRVAPRWLMRPTCAPPSRRATTHRDRTTPCEPASARAAAAAAARSPGAAAALRVAQAAAEPAAARGAERLGGGRGGRARG